MKSVFLDTTAYSRYCKRDIKVGQLLQHTHKIYLSSVSLGELYSGFKQGDKELENVDILRSFIDDPKVEIVDVTAKTAVFYGRTKYALRKKGTPIPDNDIWIAASAISNRSVLITFDRHFLEIPELKVWKDFLTH